MFNGEHYQRNNTMQRVTVKQIIDEFASRFNWREDGQDSLLDIGCGIGDVTADYILPILPQKFTRLVAADISESMLCVARINLQNSKVFFETIDIGITLDLGVWTTPFDHITSFYCLHWVPDQLQAFENIHRLLAPTGNCLLAFVCSYPCFRVHPKLARYARWAPHLQDIERFIPPYQSSHNPVESIERILSDTGFSEYSVQIRDMTFVHNGLDSLRCFIRAVSPFINRFTEQQQNDFLDDFMAEMEVDPPYDYTPSGQIIIHYTLIVIFAHK